MLQNNKVWLLNGGDKSAKSKEIKVAKELLREIKK
jgi:putative component of toxin-antitoxin plasmid stabilization module